MKIITESSRLILREITAGDEEGMFKLYSDPEVMRYVNALPITDKQQSRDAITSIMNQYREHGQGLWAALILKDTKVFIGWARLKFIGDTVNGETKFYDLGFRLVRKYWGRGMLPKPYRRL